MNLSGPNFFLSSFSVSVNESIVPFLLTTVDLEAFKLQYSFVYVYSNINLSLKICRSVPTSLGRTNIIFTWASNNLKPTILVILMTCIFTPQRVVLYCECQEHKSKAMNNHETCPKGSNFLKL